LIERIREARIKDLFFCILSAFLLILSFPDADISFLAWVGFVPLFFAVKNKPRIKAFLLAYLTGLIFWAGTIYWLVHVTLPGTILLVLYLALYFGFFGAIITKTFLKPTYYHPFVIPTVWVILEYIRSYLFTGFPWALLGYSQYRNLAVIQVADFTGVWGVSFLVVIANVAAKELITYRLKVSGYRYRAKQFFIVFLAGLIFVLSYGFFRLSEKRDGLGLKVCVVQGNIPQELKWASGSEGFILNRYALLTEEAARTKPDLIVWPEASSPAILGYDDALFENIFTLSRKIKIPLLIGAVVNDNGRYFNSALLIGRKATIVSRYDKLHLVPFGEYIPLKKFLPFLQVVVPIGDIDRGKEYTIFKTLSPEFRTTGSFSTLICFEDLFPELSRRFVKKGADFLVNITNDAWYKKTQAAAQHFQASVFRAVENHVFLLRSANTGISGFISPTGRIISLVQDENGEKLFVSGIETEQITLMRPRNLSFYSRYGDVFIFLLSIFAIYSIFRLAI